LTSKLFKNVVSISQPTIPEPLIGGIRRRLRSMERDPWDANQEFGPEAGDESPTDGEVAESREAYRSDSKLVNAADFYKILMTTAIENGGKLGDHQISVPWLRMILAGLEFKRIDTEAMWYGAEGAASGGEPLAKIPDYDDLFPSARQAFASVR
jgi:hypothetical protein